jgi:hypothetical protein
MKQRLSSLQTFFAKIIFPLVWVTIWVFGFFASLSKSGHVDWTLLFFFLASLLFIYYSSIRLKAVSVDGQYLYVSNYFKEEWIPLSHIDQVTENKWVGGHPVTIHLSCASEFGDKIVFMPTVRFLNIGPHPVVKELLALAKSKGGCARLHS